MNISTHRTRVFILNQEGAFLAMVRNFKDRTGIHSPMVLLPGGGIDRGEESSRSVRRETKEELDIDLVDMKHFLSHSETAPATLSDQSYYPEGCTSVTRHLDFYTAHVADGQTPQLMEPEKFDEIAWVTPEGFHALAQKHNASVGDGIVEAMAFLFNASVIV